MARAAVRESVTVAGLADRARVVRAFVDAVLDPGHPCEADLPRKLVQTWRMTMTSKMAAEAFTRLTYDIEPARGGVTKLTVAS